LLVRQGREDGKNYTANLVNSQVVPSYENLALPAVREYRDLMSKNPTVPADLSASDYQPLPSSFVSFEGFFNARLLVEILNRLGDHPTRARIAGAVAGIQNFDLGMGPPITFADGRNQGAEAIYYTTVEGGRFVPIRDWKEWAK
ncbi:MAG: hypothetical protein RLZZ53_1316, partial [Acidobacteriota bacterium]